MVMDSKNKMIILTAEEGMVFKSKIDGTILTRQLFLGCNDRYENYEEISEEEAYEDGITLQNEEQEEA